MGPSNLWTDHPIECRVIGKLLIFEKQFWLLFWLEEEGSAAPIISFSKKLDGPSMNDFKASGCMQEPIFYVDCIKCTVF